MSGRILINHGNFQCIVLYLHHRLDWTCSSLTHVFPPFSSFAFFENLPFSSSHYTIHYKPVFSLMCSALALLNNNKLSNLHSFSHGSSTGCIQAKNSCRPFLMLYDKSPLKFLLGSPTHWRIFTTWYYRFRSCALARSFLPTWYSRVFLLQPVFAPFCTPSHRLTPMGPFFPFYSYLFCFYHYNRSTNPDPFHKFYCGTAGRHASRLMSSSDMIKSKHPPGRQTAETPQQNRKLKKRMCSIQFFSH